MTENTNLSIMYSGGLDSFIAWHYALKTGFKPQAIFVDLGHPYAEKEWDAIQSIPDNIRPPVDRINIKELSPLLEKRLTNQIIPSRNVLLATIGGMFNSNVWINALDGEQNGKEHDKSFRFFADTTELLSFTNDFFQEHTTVASPFHHLSKAETIKWALENGIPKEDLFKTTSCYDDHSRKCGTCLACYKRYTAFLLNDIKEPDYDTNPMESDYAKELEIEIPKALIAKDYSRFTKKRIQEWLDVQVKLGDSC